MNKHKNKNEEAKSAAAPAISPQTYSQIVDAAAKLGVAVRMFPSDVLLNAVRSINQTCKKAQEEKTGGYEDTGAPSVEHAEKVDKVLAVCAETAEKRALLEEIGIGLTAARIRIENAMTTYAKAAAAMEEGKRERSGLFVPKAAGKVVLTDGE